MGEDDEIIKNPTTNNTNQSDKINAWGNLFSGVLGGTAAIVGAANGSANANTPTTQNDTPTTNTPSAAKPNWMLIGGIGLVVVTIIFLIASKNKNNGRSNSSAKV